MKPFKFGSRVRDAKTGRVGILAGGGETYASVRFPCGKLANVPHARLLHADSRSVDSPPPAAGRRTCTLCGETRNLYEFPACGTTKDGRSPYCRECHRAYDAVAYRGRRQWEERLR